jgi:ABC-type bacteriocin/lantibiotic exporter with double-glycine peptidase domain
MLGARLVILFFAVCVSSCGYQGSDKGVSMAQVSKEDGYTRVELVGMYQQDPKGCGSAALGTVLAYWGKGLTPQQIDQDTRRGERSLSALELRDYARRVGLRSFVFEGSFADLDHELSAGRPLIVGLAKARALAKPLAHYNVVVGYDRTQQRILTWDPASGWREDSFEGFAKEWLPTGSVTVVIFPDAEGPDASSKSLL